MENRFEPLDISDRDVIGFGDEVYKISKIRKFLTKALNDSHLSNSLGSVFHQLGIKIENGMDNKSYAGILTKGSRCEVLSVGSNHWRKGKIRVKLELEFCWDEPQFDQNISNNIHESPLDDLRKLTNQVN